MKETTKFLLQAIGSIAGEIRELRKDLERRDNNINEYIKLITENNLTLRKFKEGMNVRIEALQEAWQRHLNNHLYNQEQLIIRTIRKELFPKEKKTAKKKPVKRKKK